MCIASNSLVLTRIHLRIIRQFIQQPGAAGPREVKAGSDLVSATLFCLWYT